MVHLMIELIAITNLLSTDASETVLATLIPPESWLDLVAYNIKIHVLSFYHVKDAWS